MSWREGSGVASESVPAGLSPPCWHLCPGGGRKEGDGAGCGLGVIVAQMGISGPPPSCFPPVSLHRLWLVLLGGAVECVPSLYPRRRVTVNFPRLYDRASIKRSLNPPSSPVGNDSQS